MVSKAASSVMSAVLVVDAVREPFPLGVVDLRLAEFGPRVADELLQEVAEFLLAPGFVLVDAIHAQNLGNPHSTGQTR